MEGVNKMLREMLNTSFDKLQDECNTKDYWHKKSKELDSKVKQLEQELNEIKLNKEHGNTENTLEKTN